MGRLLLGQREGRKPVRFLIARKDLTNPRVPKVSIVLPVRDGAEYLPQALNSVLDQAFRDFEIIAIDDGSVDETSAILAGYSQIDSRLRIFRNDQAQGLVFSLNRGLDLANGVYLARMDADDICLPGRLEAQVSFLEEHPGVDFLATAYYRWMPDGRLSPRFPAVTHTEIRWRLLFGNIFAHPTFMFRRKLLEVSRPFYLDIQAAEDYELVARLSREYRLHCLSDPLVVIRMLDSGISVSQAAVQTENALKISRSMIGDVLGLSADASEIRSIRPEKRSQKVSPGDQLLFCELFDRFGQLPAVDSAVLTRLKRQHFASVLAKLPWSKPTAWQEIGQLLLTLAKDPMNFLFLIIQPCFKIAKRLGRKLAARQATERDLLMTLESPLSWKRRDL